MPPKKSSKGPAKPKAMPKGELAAALAERAGLSRRQVLDLFEHVHAMLAAELAAGRPFKLFGLVNFTKAVVPAKKAQPATEKLMFGNLVQVPARPARPASHKLKVAAPKAVKELV